MPPRPHHHEICKKIADALAAIKAGRISLVLTKHLVWDLEGLELESATELSQLLIELLDEIQHAGPIQCYAGSRPPQRSYEPEIRDLELWAYAWHSQRLQRPMYLKFAIKNQCYVYVDCHTDNPPME